MCVKGQARSDNAGKTGGMGLQWHLFFAALSGNPVTIHKASIQHEAASSRYNSALTRPGASASAGEGSSTILGAN